MWMLDGQSAQPLALAVQQAGFFQTDFWHAFLIFASQFIALKVHEGTKTPKDGQ